jgi:hypothetical protein
MVHIKKYRVEGQGYSGTPYTMDLDFTKTQVGNQCYFDREKGIPLNVAEGLVNGWNRTVKMYGKPTFYSIIMPAMKMPDAPSCSSTEIPNIEDVSVQDMFEGVRRGIIGETLFERWLLASHANTHKDGYNDGVSEAKAMIDSLLKE